MPTACTRSSRAVSPAPACSSSAARRAQTATPSPSARARTMLAAPALHNETVTTVLVVDDEPIVRDVVVRYLNREGFRTLEAADGDSARALLEREQPSLVVLDLMLPGTDGLTRCRWIREPSQVPVIILTALGEWSDRTDGLQLGAY